MNRPCTRALLSSTAAALLAAGLPGTALGSESTEAEALCLDGRSGTVSLTRETTGRNKKAVHTGDFYTAWSIAGPACPGVEYVLTVTSMDGSALGWSGTTTSTKTPVGTATNPAVTVDTSTPTAVEVVLKGDGQTTQFVVEGQTNGYEPTCIKGTVSMRLPNTGQVTGEGAAFEDCDDSVVGGSSYY